MRSKKKYDSDCKKQGMSLSLVCPVSYSRIFRTSVGVAPKCVQRTSSGNIRAADMGS